MKSKDEILNLTPDELSGKLQELKEEMANLKLQKATHQITNPLRIRTVRRSMARVRTLLTEYEKGIREIKKETKE
jgi:large subunit ribosomal protein L29